MKNSKYSSTTRELILTTFEEINRDDSIYISSKVNLSLRRDEFYIYRAGKEVVSFYINFDSSYSTHEKIRLLERNYDSYLNYLSGREKCSYIIPWIGKCGKDCDEYRCEEHKDLKCFCGKPAVKGCSHTSFLVCGNPLCEDHSKCNFHQRGDE